MTVSLEGVCPKGIAFLPDVFVKNTERIMMALSQSSPGGIEPFGWLSLRVYLHLLFYPLFAPFTTCWREENYFAA